MRADPPKDTEAAGKPRMKAWHWIAGGFVALVAVLIALGSLSGGSHYAVNVSGSMPAVQTVAQSVSMPLHIGNRGKALPDLLVDVGGCTDHWVLDGVTEAGVPVSAASGTYYDFGGLAAGDSENIALQLVPRDAGNHTCEIKMWTGPLSSGVPTGDELETVSTKVAINP